MRAALVVSALCGLADALHKADVPPLYDAVEYFATRSKKVTENPCAQSYTPEYCPAEQWSPHSVHAVFSSYHEDLRWLLSMDWKENISVYVHDRVVKKSHSSKSTVADTLLLAEEAEAEVKAITSLSKNPIHFEDIPNKGDEAAAYLAFIIQKYNKLPDVTFFMQGHRCAEHARFDMAIALPNIRKCFTPDRGYLDLNTYHDAKVRCKFTDAILDHPIRGFHVEKFGELWKEVFQQELGRMPVKICWDAFAQFAVSRDRIRKHPVEFYRKVLKAVIKGNTTMEFFWRALFVPDALSWEHSPIKPRYQFTEEELRERERYVDLRGQHNDENREWQ